MFVMLSWNNNFKIRNIRIFYIFRKKTSMYDGIGVTVLNKVHHICSERGSRCGATGTATVQEAVASTAPL